MSRKTNKIICAPSEELDQTSLISLRSPHGETLLKHWWNLKEFCWFCRAAAPGKRNVCFWLNLLVLFKKRRNSSIKCKQHERVDSVRRCVFYVCLPIVRQDPSTGTHGINGFKVKLSRSTTKPTKCAQRRLRSALTSAQSDQSSLYAHWVANDPWFVHAGSQDSYQTMRMPRGWSVSSLDAQVILLVLSCCGLFIRVRRPG